MVAPPASSDPGVLAFDVPPGRYDLLGPRFWVPGAEDRARWTE